MFLDRMLLLVTLHPGQPYRSGRINRDVELDLQMLDETAYALVVDEQMLLYSVALGHGSGRAF